MKLFNILAAGTLAGLFATSAMAASDAVINQIAQQLAAQGYTQIHIVNRNGSVDVDATGPNGAISATYDNSGNVMSSSNDGGTSSTATSGSLVSGVVAASNTTVGNDNLYGDGDGDTEGAGDNDDNRRSGTSSSRSSRSGNDDNGRSGHSEGNESSGHEAGEHNGGGDNDD